MEQQTSSKLGKEYIKAEYCHPDYLTYMQSTSCEMQGWMKHKLETRLSGELSITSHMQMIPCLWQKMKRNKTASWWKWKRKGKKVGLKLNIQKTDHGIQPHHFMANRWGDNGNRDFIFMGSKITACGDCSHEIKRCLLLERKVMINLDNILESRYLCWQGYI